MSELKRLFFCLLYYGCAQWLPSSYIRGCAVFGLVRAAICRQLFASCGREARIEPRAFFSSGRKVSLGDHSSIGENAKIRGSVRIGSHVMMGEDVLIISGNHAFDRTDIPMTWQGFLPDETVEIGDDVWIGSRVILLPGVKVGRGAVIGAGAVVTKDVPAWAVTAGNPARLIRSRKSQDPV